MIEVVRAYFDGLTEPVNPGGYACGGWYVEPFSQAPEGIAGGRLYCHGDGATNNVAEYRAALDTLRVIYKAGYTGPVVLHGDSQLVIKQVTGEWNCTYPHLEALRDQLRHAATFFQSIRFEWVPRERNERADHQSRAAYKRVTGREAPVRRRKTA